MAEGPDFLCIGAAKAGTQWLYDQLLWHPGAWMPPVKELHYFDRPANHAARPSLLRTVRQIKKKGLENVNREREADLLPPLRDRDIQFLERLAARNGIDFKAYCELFAAKGTELTGEFTPAYSGLPWPTVQQIAQALPHLRIIYLVRDPVARAWSHLQMLKRQAEDRGGSFAIHDLDVVRAFCERPHVKVASRPTETLSLWRRAFPKDQVQHQFFDDIVRSPAQVRTSILTFLGLDPARGSETIAPDFNRKSATSKYTLVPEVRQYLIDIFREEIERCVQEFGEPARRWQQLYEQPHEQAA